MSIKTMILGVAAIASVALPGAASAQRYGYGYGAGYYGQRFDGYDDRYDRHERHRWEQRRRFEERERRREWERRQRYYDHYNRGYERDYDRY